MLQPSPLTRLPSSQTSPSVVSTTRLPQVSLDLQSVEQPSLSWVLPSSQASVGSLTPLPHWSDAGTHDWPSRLQVNPGEHTTPPLHVSLAGRKQVESRARNAAHHHHLEVMEAGVSRPRRRPTGR